MISQKYQDRILSIIGPNLEKSTKAFIYGSSLSDGIFNDVDLGIEGEGIDDHLVHKIKNELEDSNLPYIVDVINFNTVSDKFKKSVFKNKVLWLT